MAHSLSAKKRVRQNLKHRARNRARKSDVRIEVKAFQAALVGGDLAKAETALRSATKRLDKVAAAGTLHKNTVARKRSRLTRSLNAAKAAAAAKPATA